MRTKLSQWLTTPVFLIASGFLIAAIGIYLFQLPARLLLPGAVQPPQDDSSDRAETLEARVVGASFTDSTQSFQRLDLEFVGGSRRGERAQAEHDLNALTHDQVPYRVGDYVLVDMLTHPNGQRELVVSDYAHNDGLAALLALFIGVTILVSGWKGIRALLGLLISFVILWYFVLPRILTGQDPVAASLAGSAVLLAVTLYLAQGWSLKTHAALLGILASLLLTGLFSSFAVDLTHLSGYGSEEAIMVHAAGAVVNLRGLLLAGMLVGALGVLYDMAISQASAVTELADANPALGWRDLYQRAMNIGHDHIAATINTLALAYVGVAMPFLLYFQLNPHTWIVALNSEFVSEELVRILVGSLGLIAAVPMTTIAASVLRHRLALRAPTSRSGTGGGTNL